MTTSSESRKWIRRQVVRYEIVDDARIAMETELHLDLTVLSVLPAYSKEETVLVPVAWLPRRVHYDLHVTGPDGSELPRITRTEERELVKAYLSSLSLPQDEAAQAAERAPYVEREVRRLLREHVEKSTSHHSRRRLIHGWLDDRVLICRAILKDRCCRKDVPTNAQPMNPILEAFSQHSWVIVLVPKEVARQPFVIRFRIRTQQSTVRIGRFDRPLLERRSPWGQVNRAALATFTVGKNLVLGSTLSFSVTHSVRNARYAAAHHVYLKAPDGYQVVDGELSITGTREITGKPDTSVEFVVPDDDELDGTAHFLVPSLPEEVKNVMIKVRSSFYLRCTGFFVQYLMSICLSGTTLFVYGTFVTRCLRSDGDLDLTQSAFNSNFAASSVLLVPAVAMAVVIEREHVRISARLLRVARIEMFVMFSLCLIGSMTMAVELDNELRRISWECVRWAALFLTCRSALTGARHVYRISRFGTRLRHLRQQLSNLRKEQLFFARKGSHSE